MAGAAVNRGKGILVVVGDAIDAIEMVERVLQIVYRMKWWIG